MRETVIVGWDGASRPMRRYRDELDLPEWQRAVAPASLPTEIGTPTMIDVLEDNPHGTGWELTEGGDQGEGAHKYDRFWARYRSDEGYIADYFHIAGRWGLGAN